MTSNHFFLFLDLTYCEGFCKHYNTKEKQESFNVKFKNYLFAEWHMNITYIMKSVVGLGA